ncbi:MAG: undecaprenyldiphospho-muramoylpentapeptide beta-N-acetylglucosaminyltransferase [Kangiella sp.]|nr:MAG: undecaprenyldiphospho-muramoylpentapeptide beta-N-acetylglucosaminyltransferase [Kangiella sp.]
MTFSNIQNKSEKRVLIMAGGTGGHIFPGLAVAKELQKRDWNVFWLGSHKGMEEEIIAKTDIPLSLIRVVGLRGNGLLGWLKAPFLITKSVMSAIVILRKIKPHLVIGFGGFASGPGGLATYLLRIKLFIHEQNAIAGMTNRYLSKLANKVFLGFPNALGDKQNYSTKNSGKIKVVGNPIRDEIKKNIRVERDINKSLNLLVLGGSRGARTLNLKLPKILDSISSKRIKIIHQCGKGNQQTTIEEYSKFSCDVEILDFIENMADRLAWADVVICRAGASSVAEVAAVGLTAIFIPFPFAVDDHQYFNALWLSENNAGKIIQDSDLGSMESKKLIEDLLGSENDIVNMGLKAKKLAYLNAAEDIADECDSSIKTTFTKESLKVA